MQIRRERAGTTLVMHLAGDLDEKTSADFRSHVDRAIDEGTDHLILVLRELTFIDSSGLGVLIGRYRHLLRQGGRVSLVEPRSHVESLLEIAGIPRLMPIYPSERDALTDG